MKTAADVNKSIDTLLTNNNISIHRNRDAPIIGPFADNRHRLITMPVLANC